MQGTALLKHVKIRIPIHSLSPSLSLTMKRSGWQSAFAKGTQLLATDYSGS